MAFERKLVEQCVLLDLPFPIIDRPPAVVMRDYSATPFFNTIAPLLSLVDISGDGL
jgi:hypothetical protein